MFWFKKEKKRDDSTKNRSGAAASGRPDLFHLINDDEYLAHLLTRRDFTALPSGFKASFKLIFPNGLESTEITAAAQRIVSITNGKLEIESAKEVWRRGRARLHVATMEPASRFSNAREIVGSVRVYADLKLSEKEAATVLYFIALGRLPSADSYQGVLGELAKALPQLRP